MTKPDLLLCLLILLLVGCATANVTPRCGVTVVSYRFTGEAGLMFRFNGETHTIPSTGRLELLANGRDVAIVDRWPIALEAFAVDRFGCRHVDLGTRAEHRHDDETRETTASLDLLKK